MANRNKMNDNDNDDDELTHDGVQPGQEIPNVIQGNVFYYQNISATVSPVRQEKLIHPV